MYKIFKGNDVVGIVDVPTYIAEKNGVYISATVDSAQGVSFDSVPYRLSGLEDYTEAFKSLDEVLLVETDGSSEITLVDNTHDTNEANLVLANMVEWQSYIDNMIESGYDFSNDTESLKRKYTMGYVRNDQLLLMVKKNLISQAQYDSIVA